MQIYYTKKFGQKHAYNKNEHAYNYFGYIKNDTITKHYFLPIGQNS